MAEFWEENFKEKQAMWGLNPCDSAVSTAKLFKESGVHSVLIPGFGYGRNAQVFLKNGCEVTGIEISETAINLAEEHFDNDLTIHSGSVGEMPFDGEFYDGIFCYALIHLLDEAERIKFIKDCYNQLKPDGLMVFIAISTEDPNFAKGEVLSENRFKTKHGVNLFYYDAEAVESEFGDFGLIDAEEISEPEKIIEGKPYQQFWKIICQKY
ncbi:class I SAM-dependent methyltransferase [Tamlana haliotis]|uniref:Class I SAM-dependent methyltransferase n=1 Tax=Pseudotamlana haliotis TaxID=2614804 RepID=A0A6N6MFR4_9FLAO|nr:class I SAM-dependent methyltransferase [Tamlana haliotis]KAB1068639.1 class I SAM-dependent methyltransferase [Tamlana haliotis]